MGGVKFSRRKVPVRLVCARRSILNRRGAAMLLALVVTMALLPATAAMAAMARTDLAAALDDYHRFKAQCAAQGALTLAAADLRRGGDGQAIWPDPDVSVEISIAETEAGWQVTVAARCGRAVGNCSGEVAKEPGAERDDGELFSRRPVQAGEGT